MIWFPNWGGNAFISSLSSRGYFLSERDQLNVCVWRDPLCGTVSWIGCEKVQVGFICGAILGRFFSVGAFDRCLPVARRSGDLILFFWRLLLFGFWRILPSLRPEGWEVWISVNSGLCFVPGSLWRIRLWICGWRESRFLFRQIAWSSLDLLFLLLLRDRLRGLSRDFSTGLLGSRPFLFASERCPKRLELGSPSLTRVDVNHRWFPC